MSLKKYIENINTESSQQLNIASVLVGRFSPPHFGHIKTYESLCEQWGDDNVWVLTAEGNKNARNPFSFEEKKQMLILGGVRTDRIKLLTGSAYNWETISQIINVDPNNTALIAAMGKKDKDRLTNGKYYLSLTENLEFPMSSHGYIQAIKNTESLTGIVLSATMVREAIIKNDLSTIQEIVPDPIINWLQRWIDNKNVISEETSGSFLSLAGGIRKVESALGSLEYVIKIIEKKENKNGNILERKLGRIRKSLLAAAEEFGVRDYEGKAHKEKSVQLNIEWAIGLLADVLNEYDNGADNPLSWSKDCMDIVATMTDTSRKI